MIIAVPDVIITGAYSHIFDPFGHALVLLLENTFVTIGEVNGPRNDYRHVCPTCCATSGIPFSRQDVWDYIRNTSTFQLIGSNVAQPFCVKPGHIHIKCSCSREHLRITSPPKSFISLGTVCG